MIIDNIVVVAMEGTGAGVGVVMRCSTIYRRRPRHGDELLRLWFERMQPLTFKRRKCRESAAVMASVAERILAGGDVEHDSANLRCG